MEYSDLFVSVNCGELAWELGALETKYRQPLLELQNELNSGLCRLSCSWQYSLVFRKKICFFWDQLDFLFQ